MARPKKRGISPKAALAPELRAELEKIRKVEEARRWTDEFAKLRAAEKKEEREHGERVVEQARALQREQERREILSGIERARQAAQEMAERRRAAGWRSTAELVQDARQLMSHIGKTLKQATVAERIQQEKERMRGHNVPAWREKQRIVAERAVQGISELGRNVDELARMDAKLRSAQEKLDWLRARERYRQEKEKKEAKEKLERKVRRAKQAEVEALKEHPIPPAWGSTAEEWARADVLARNVRAHDAEIHGVMEEVLTKGRILAEEMKRAELRKQGKMEGEVREAARALALAELDVQKKRGREEVAAEAAAEEAEKKRLHELGAAKIMDEALRAGGTEVEARAKGKSRHEEFLRRWAEKQKYSKMLPGAERRARIFALRREIIKQFDRLGALVEKGDKLVEKTEGFLKKQKAEEAQRQEARWREFVADFEKKQREIEEGRRLGVEAEKRRFEEGMKRIDAETREIEMGLKELKEKEKEERAEAEARTARISQKAEAVRKGEEKKAGGPAGKDVARELQDGMNAMTARLQKLAAQRGALNARIAKTQNPHEIENLRNALKKIEEERQTLGSQVKFLRKKFEEMERRK